MDARTILAHLRAGRTPSDAELRWFANGLADGGVSDAQAGAFAMAAVCNGLGDQGRVALTCAMRDSGDVLAWDLPGPVIDKHSTGGIGDCLSLVLAPALAACGAYVPMISGRGLGHTGGTLDKLAAIPGVDVTGDSARLQSITRGVGCAILGASARIAPADSRLYAVRDVTATVDHIDLITASILSKKLAAGLDGLVLDVKCGSGAFMQSLDGARDLAGALCDTANGAGCPTTAMITDMNQPLAPAMGNATEVAVCMQLFEAGRSAAPRLYDLTIALGAQLLAATGQDHGAGRLEHALASGAARDRFGAMIHAMGGPPDMAQDWRTHLPQAPVQMPLLAQASGYVTVMDGQALGMAVIGLGGGRRVESDRIDPRVGISDICALGTAVAPDTPLCMIHAADADSADRAAQAIRAAFTIADTPAAAGPLIIERIT